MAVRNYLVNECLRFELFQISVREVCTSSPLLWRCGGVTSLLAAVSGSKPGRVGICNKNSFLGTREDDGAEPQSLILFQIYMS